MMGNYFKSKPFMTPIIGVFIFIIFLYVVNSPWSIGLLPWLPNDLRVQETRF